MPINQEICATVKAFRQETFFMFWLSSTARDTLGQVPFIKNGDNACTSTLKTKLSEQICSLATNAIDIFMFVA